MAALSDYAAVITRLGAGDVRMVATSATRDAANAGEFVRRVTAVLGAAPEVLSGDEEARLSFTGATAELDGDPSAEPPYLVVDIGGGSTEFVLGAAGAVSAARQRRHRVCPDDRAAPAFRPAVAGADRRGHGRHRRCRRARGGHGRRRPGAHPRRPGRIGHHRGGHRAGPARVRLRPAAPRAHPGRRGARGGHAAALPHPGGAGPDRGDAPGPGGRHRGRGAHPRPHHEPVRPAPTSWSASTTSWTASPGRSRRRRRLRAGERHAGRTAGGPAHGGPAERRMRARAGEPGR